MAAGCSGSTLELPVRLRARDSPAGGGRGEWRGDHVGDADRCRASGWCANDLPVRVRADQEPWARWRRRRRSTPVSGTGPVTAMATLTGLKPQTFYYYRLKATVGGTEVYGNVRSLRTGGPSAALGGAGDLGPSSATFSGTVDSYDLGAATYHFLVEGVGSPFSTVSAELPVPAGSGPRTVAASVAGLPSGQRFTARLIATAGGRDRGQRAGELSDAGARSRWRRVRRPSSNPSPYGCGAPVLAAPTARFARAPWSRSPARIWVWVALCSSAVRGRRRRGGRRRRCPSCCLRWVRARFRSVSTAARPPTVSSCR